jgi:hypothetical protein
MAFAKALKRNSVIQKLSLGLNNLDLGAKQALDEALKINKSLHFEPYGSLY